MLDPPSVFVTVFGETPFIKSLDFFLTYDSFDYSKCQVADEIGIARMTMDKIWNELIEKNIIVKTRIVGRANMYKLNKKNPLVKTLLEFDMKLCSNASKNHLISIKN
ncbi:MAG: hypothetical protein KJ906_03605 [Nanoarchaeota archaeon]|nr:hypothetical protein [Nanoarchaeota archaeon]